MASYQRKENIGCPREGRSLRSCVKAATGEEGAPSRKWGENEYILPHFFKNRHKKEKGRKKA